MRPLSERERKLVAVGILLLLVAAIQLCVVAPIVDGFTARAARREALLLRHQHNAQTIAAIGRLRRSAERQTADLAKFMLAAPTAERGSELLKDRLQRAIETAGGEFRSSDDVPTPGGWIRARATGQLTLGQLIPMLAQLQNQPPYLVVESLSVVADEAERSGQLSPMDVKIEAAIPYHPAAAR